MLVIRIVCIPPQAAVGANASARFLVLGKRIDISLQTLRSETVLHLAARAGNERIIKLCWSGPRILRPVFTKLFPVTCDNGLTAVDVARSRGNASCAALLDRLEGHTSSSQNRVCVCVCVRERETE